MEDQTYVACQQCEQSPQCLPIVPSAETAAALAAVTPMAVNEAPATPHNANLIEAVEAFARRNVRHGADVAAVVDRMLAALVRCTI